MQIGDLSARSGVNLETIRYFELLGILLKQRAKRTAGESKAWPAFACCRPYRISQRNRTRRRADCTGSA